MADGDADVGPVLFGERGASWWPLLWAPAFGALGLIVEWLTPGPMQPAMWLLVAGALLVFTVMWLNGRRKVCSMRLTPETLRQGRETLPVERITEVEDVGAPAGARVLGGGWVPPRGRHSVPVGLDNGEVVLAWAADPVGLQAALARLIGAGEQESGAHEEESGSEDGGAA